MKYLWMLLFLVILMTACAPQKQRANNEQRYSQLTEEKYMLVQKYSEYLTNPDKNRNKLNDIDKKLHQINTELKDLSTKPDVANLMNQKFERRTYNRKPAKSESDEPEYITNTDENNQDEDIDDEGFEYLGANEEVDETFDAELDRESDYSVNDSTNTDIETEIPDKDIFSEKELELNPSELDETSETNTSE